ncbi:MAG: hypothetical protein HKM02_09345, partial [Pseudomonadales bacterium]|nr:hypothetical protein [Pseudomonadales bacterium]
MTVRLAVCLLDGRATTRAFLAVNDNFFAIKLARCNSVATVAAQTLAAEGRVAMFLAIRKHSGLKLQAV